MESNINSLVSVIIPCYNDHVYIQEAIDSVNNQTYQNIEIVIIDDGSRRETKEFLKKIQQENLTILYQENAGPSSARNNGIRHAKGDFILTLDADDYFDATFVEKAMFVFNQESNVGLVTCNGYIFNENGVVDEIISEEGDAGHFLFNNSAIGNSLFRKKCWAAIGGFDENMKKGYEDWDFHVSLIKANWKIKVIKEYLFHYRDKPDSRNSQADKFHKYDLWKYIYIKHKDVLVDNQEVMINTVFSQMEILEMNCHNLRGSMDYRIGNKILKPFRFIKGLGFKRK
ncbi:MAG: glycosyltransferase family A protein [Flavobacterium circumlabens]|uniref:glycosyltransferase family 2 protein n=1 Tax=Flavobacterium circumlabens TaxID=2133765 RepID=UPI003265E113